MATGIFFNTIVRNAFKNAHEQGGVFFTLVHCDFDEDDDAFVSLQDGDNIEKYPNRKIFTPWVNTMYIPEKIQDIPERAVLCSGQAQLIGDRTPPTYLEIDLRVSGDKAKTEANQCAVVFHTKDGVPIFPILHCPIQALDGTEIESIPNMKITIVE